MEILDAGGSPDAVEGGPAPASHWALMACPSCFSPGRLNRHIERGRMPKRLKSSIWRNPTTGDYECWDCWLK